MNTFVLATLAASAMAITEVESNFLGYITQFGKNYQNIEEYTHRLAQFTRNHFFIEGHNSAESNFKLGHNKMSDWTEEEYKSILTYQPHQNQDAEFVEHVGSD